MKRLLFLLLAFTFVKSFAQEAVVFKIQYLPSKSYKMSMDLDVESIMNFSGNQEKIDQIKASGTSLPITVLNLTQMATTTTTSPTNSKGLIPARIVFDKATSKNTINGKETSVDQPSLGLIVVGNYDVNKIIIDSLVSDRLDAASKDAMRTVIENMQASIKFPEKPMRVGDTFDQEVPMQIPIAGANPFNMTVKTAYILKSIGKEKANFDIRILVTLNMDDNNSEMAAEGAGDGLVEYDIRDMQISRTVSNMEMTLKMMIQDLQLEGKMKIKSTQEISVN